MKATIDLKHLIDRIKKEIEKKNQSSSLRK